MVHYVYMAPIGGGAVKSLSHRHFWLVFITFAVIVGGLWTWHRFKIREAVQVEQSQYQQFQAEQRKAPQRVSPTTP